MHTNGIGRVEGERESNESGTIYWTNTCVVGSALRFGRQEMCACTNYSILCGIRYSEIIKSHEILLEFIHSINFVYNFLS